MVGISERELITKSEDLKKVVATAFACGYAALDTEFVWERTYYARLGLVQIGMGRDSCHLVDTVDIDDLTPLGELLSSPDVVKILHDAGQDLTILRRATGAYPKNIFDTRLASGFVGLSSTLSLGDVVSATTGVQLAKTEARTDWIRRPLSERQIEYALDDVRYLPDARDELLRRAEALGRVEWMAEELAQYDAPEQYEDPDERTQYLRVKGHGKRRGRELIVLRELAAWRESEARRRNRPRGHIVSDELLVTLARRLPASQRELARVDSRVAEGDYAQGLLDAIAIGLNAPEESSATTRSRNGEDETLTARVDFALAYIKGKCLAEGVDHALVGNRSAVTEIVRNGHDEGGIKLLLHGWRQDFVGQELLEVLSGKRLLRIDPKTGLPVVISEN